MIYRDDEISILRNEVKTLKKRLDKFESLYKNGGIKRRQGLIAKFFSKVLFDPAAWIAGFVVGFFKGIFKHWMPILFSLIIAVAITGLVTFIAWTDHERQVQAELTVNTRLQQGIEQCTSFCESNGYQFNDRREELCYCRTAVSVDTAFIINTTTGENWTISSSREQQQ